MSFETPSGQLLPNRVILSKVNTVIRKEAIEKETEAPSEWTEGTSEAYRLLVGPNISEYLPSEDLPKTSTKNSSLGQTKNNKPSYSEIRQSLNASRLKIPYKATKVTAKDLMALKMPADIVADVFPAGRVRRFDLLGRQSSKSRRKIIRPVVKDYSATPLTRVGVSESNQQSGNETENSSMAEVEEIFTSDVHAEDNSDLVELQTEQDNVEPVSENVSPYGEFKTSRQLRAYFYVLRCWARYRINARVKAAFLADIYNTHKQLSCFGAWNRYVRRVQQMHQMGDELKNRINSRIIRSIFCLWEQKAKDAILNEGFARKVMTSKSLDILKTYFKGFLEITHSRMIYRRDKRRIIRGKPRGHLLEINSYYETKRQKIIKATQHYYEKRATVVLQLWRDVSQREHRDIQRIRSVHNIFLRCMLKNWWDCYKRSLHQKLMMELRQWARKRRGLMDEREQKGADSMSKAMIQLVKDRGVLSAKLSEFDRLTENQHAAMINREAARRDINATIDQFFKTQEEETLQTVAKEADEVCVRTREIRRRLADGFLLHLDLAIRRYHNHRLFSQFNIAFDALSQPILNKAVAYFCEKRHMKSLVASAKRSSATLKAIVACSTLYHKAIGLALLRHAQSKVSHGRSSGLMNTIRRRTTILQLYPYFDWNEVLPVRPPRAISEIRSSFKDLPPESLQKKIDREVQHHITVMCMIRDRRLLRDFLRAYASYVQVLRATREVLQLMERRRQISLLLMAFSGFHKSPVNLTLLEEINRDISAWFRHFFRFRVKQQQLANAIPLE